MKHWLALILFFISLVTFAKKEPIALNEIFMFQKAVAISVPSNFILKTGNEISAQSIGESNAELQYIDESNTVYITFYADNLPTDERSLPAVTKIMENALRSMHPKAKWKNTGVKKIIGGNVGFVEYINKKPEKYYELVFFTNYRGQLLSGVFHAPKKGYKPWKTASYEIMESLKLLKVKE